MSWNWRFKIKEKIRNDSFFSKRRFGNFGKTTFFMFVIIMFAGGYSLLNYAPFKIFNIQPKLENASQKTYQYYIIVDEKTDEHLMYVPVTVRLGDELISENNNRYVIVKIVDDVAYARFAEDNENISK